jgi:hypothetical protein
MKYQLTHVAAGQGVDFSGHVGQIVEVIGTTAPASAAGATSTVPGGVSAGSTSGANTAGSVGTVAPGSTGTSSAAATGQAPLSTFNVTSIRMVSGTCR